MKELGDFEKSIIDGGEVFKRSLSGALNNMGRIVALIAALITVTVTFTDITFSSLTPSSTLPTLLLLLTSSYIIYFSLEDSGEKLGERCDEYKSAKARYDGLSEKIGGEDIDRLRAFLSSYCKKELEYRRRRALLSSGISDTELDAYNRGELKNKRKIKLIRRAERLKIADLTPRTLLSPLSSSRESELSNPERAKLKQLIFKLIPSTVCMTVTVSVMLNVKDGMTAADVLNAMIKLSSLPLIGFRGYSAGYNFAKNTRSLWYRTRADVIEAFLREEEGQTKIS